jgi:hypothetical protein
VKNCETQDDYNAGASPRGRPVNNNKSQIDQDSIIFEREYYPQRQAQGPASTASTDKAQGPASTTERFVLGDIVGRFKSLTTYKYIFGVENYNWTPFYKKLWQRNYFERIIRNEKQLYSIRIYIKNNPLKHSK